MSNWKKTNLPCPCGLSSDAYAIDKKGNGYCFRGDCKDPVHIKNYSKRNWEEEEELPEENIKIDHVPYRGINKATVKFYDILTKVVDGKEEERCFRYPKNSFKKYKKYDRLTKNRYRSEGLQKNAGLFGQDKFDPGSKPSVTICEGEDDAPSAYQMLRGKSACVSLKSSSSARTQIEESWDWINSFDKIVLCIDNDEPGQEAVKAIAGLFDFKKVYLHKLTKHKDANAYLDANDEEDFVKGWEASKRYTPDNILSTFADFEAALKTSQEYQIGEYPLTKLNEKLYGLHAGEVVLIKAPEGVGKTETFRMMENHLLKTTKVPIGIIHLEEDNGTTVKAIAAYASGEPVDSPDSSVSDDEIMKLFKEAVQGDESRVFLHSSFDVEDEDAFCDNIRFLVSVCGCRVVFMDHITWLATGRDDEDERKKLDRISQRLKLMAKELKFCLVMISHVNDDGKTRGSRNISKVANTIIEINRDTKANDIEKFRTYFMIEKARLRGARTGAAGFAQYDPDKNQLFDPFRPNGKENEVR